MSMYVYIHMCVCVCVCECVLLTQKGLPSEDERLLGCWYHKHLLQDLLQVQHPHRPAVHLVDQKYSGSRDYT